MRGLVIAIGLLGSGVAFADMVEPPPAAGSGAGSGASGEVNVPPAPPKKVAGPETHEGQVGISARVGVGLRGIATYSDKDYCGTTSTDSSSGNSAVCIGRAPLTMDLEAAYGVSKKIDMLLELRLGIEQDFASTSFLHDGPHEVRLSPGLRYFFSEGSTTKLFTTAQVMFDFSGYKDVTGADKGNDIGVRNLNGLWFDVGHSIGAYVYAGETLAFARWLDLELEVGVGAQLRYP